MYSFRVTEDSVYVLLGPGVLKPDQVITNGKGGVSRITYDEYEAQYNAYINSELRKNNVPIVIFDSGSYTEVHPLLRAAQSYMVAGAIVRKNDNPSNPYKDLYATGNIMLRAYIDDYNALNSSSVAAPEFAISDDAIDGEYSFDSVNQKFLN